MPADLSVWDWSVRLIMAALLSGLVGFEREAHQKAAGLRTHMLVGLGAALFTLVGAYAFGGSDPTRVAAQIVTGVGFLGAGAIFRNGMSVSGLTTAAGLWAVAAIGMTSGAGLVAGAIVATAIVLIVLYGLGSAERLLRNRRISGVRRPVGVKLRDLSELNKVVKLTNTLAEGAVQTGIDGTVDSGFMVHFDVPSDKIQTLVSALSTFESVIDVAEIDPSM